MLLNSFIVLFLYAVIIFSAEISYRFAFDSFVTRKIAHIACGVLTAALPNFLDLKWTILTGVLLSIFVIISKKWKVLKGVEDTNKSSWGTMYFPLGFVLCALVFWNINTLIFSGAALVLGFADGGAAIFGRRFGIKKYRNETKSYIGSLFFILFTIIITVGTYNQFNGNLDGFTFMRLVIVVAGSTFIALMEGLFSVGEDNLYIPLAAGFLIFLVL